LADERMIALRVLETPRQVLLLFLKGASTQGADVPGGHIPPHDGDGRVHFAFAMSESDIEAWRQKLQAQNVEIISEVRPPQGGISLYFRDADGHLAELATPRIWDLESSE
jgi:catechol 2,3-dioxygenase-like lactoylglutathione lyase family enzyme